MSKQQFFDHIRPMLNGLTGQQVRGIEYLLAKTTTMPIHYRAYMLATAMLETARTFQPISEYGGASYFNNRYNPNTRVGKRLGNTEFGDGAKFRGRGFVQITGRDNYKRMSKVVGVDLVKYPELALEPRIAVQIMIHGMTTGAFTGVELSDYLDGDVPDYKGARRIINGTDRDDEIAGYANIFEVALGKLSNKRPKPKQTLMGLILSMLKRGAK